jgi:hypothetical protein
MYVLCGLFLAMLFQIVGPHTDPHGFVLTSHPPTSQDGDPAVTDPPDNQGGGGSGVADPPENQGGG